VFILWFASMAYVLVCAQRRIGLDHTPFSDATCGTIRLKLLKIGAVVRIRFAASRSPCLRLSCRRGVGRRRPLRRLEDDHTMATP
jgi:hypothetical protein